MASAARRFLLNRQFCVYIGEYGRGTSRSGAFSGNSRNAGGAFSRLEAAREGEYFFHLQEEQVKEMKQHTDEQANCDDCSKDSITRDRLYRIAAEQRAKLMKTPQIE